MATMSTAPDIPVIIIVPSPSSDPNAPPLIQSERRINPSWTLGHFKSKMEMITGVPPGSMRVEVRGQEVEGLGEESLVAAWGVGKGESVVIHDTRPPGIRANNIFDPNAPNAVPKYVMPSTTYETRSDSVLAWKKANNLGRFDPTAPTVTDLVAQRHARDTAAVAERGITTGQRCRVGGSDSRRGEVKFIGEVPEIDKEPGAVWVGVAFDEPVGKNNGTIKGKKYFDVPGEKFGAFVRPENLEVGDQFGVVDDLLDEDMEEI